jgi:hypothetical protein
MRCINCKEKFEQKVFLQKHCSNCKTAEREYQSEKMAKTEKPKYKAIAKVSPKRKLEDLKYMAQRIVFLGKKENQLCPITKWPAVEIHHTYCGKDRAQYYLDESTWIAVSRDGHNWIHDNPKEAREQGFLK